MTKLLNRIALILSILMGFFITFSLFGLFGGIRSISGDEIFIFLIISIFFGLIFKKMFLSEAFIIEKLDFFANAMEKRLIESRFTYTKKEKSFVNDEVKNEEKLEKKTEEYKEETNKNDDLFKNINDQIVESKEFKTNIDQKTEKIEEESIIMKNIKEFFSTNLLAKIGSILVFIGVLFLLSLIWGALPSLGKIIIGFIIGFSIYFTGVILDNKGLKGESRILLGTGILINFLVILAGKYILDGNINSTNYFSTGVTFLFLILNTIFGVVTSLVYQSKTMLLFSFIFAYINPFLIGGNSSTPYTLVGYSAIVSAGALIIGNKENSNTLKLSAFFLGNLLFLVAPFETEIGWITKFVATSLLSLIILIDLFKNNYKKLNLVFSLAFLFLIASLINGSDNSVISSTISFISYIISIMVFFFLGIILFIKNAIKNILSIIFFPIIVILGLLISGDLPFIEISIFTVLIAYIVGFVLLSNNNNNNKEDGKEMGNGVRYLFFALLGFFIFISNSYLSYSYIDLNFYSFLTIIIVSFIFLITSYIFSNKYSLSFLYPIGTIGAVMMLLPAVNLDLVLMMKSINNIEVGNEIINKVNLISIGSIIFFGLLNTIWPFFSKNLIREDKSIKSLIIGLIVGVLFLGGELFRYGMEYFPGISLGYAFVGLSIYYFVLAYIFITNIGFDDIKNNINYKNSLYGYLFISISLFSLAISLIFSSSPEVVSLVWLFEASILFYFFSKTKETKIYMAAIILFIIGIVKLINLQYFVKNGDLQFLIPLSIIIISFVTNLKNLEFLQTDVKKNVHDIIHIIGMLVVSSLLVKIIPQTNHGWSILGIASFVGISGIIYNYFSSKILKTFFVVITIFFTFNHIGSFDYISYRIGEDNLKHLIILQYIATAIIGAITIYWNKTNKISTFNNILNINLIFYILVIVSMYIYNIFNNTFAITIFWGIISIILLIRGISHDKKKLRTIGLYLLSLVLAKIFLYDIWYGLDNAISRVVVFILLGILLIFVSTRYSRKYGDNLVGEFSFKNLKNENNEKVEIKQKEEKVKSDDNNRKQEITSQIKSIDLKGVTSATFKINGKIAFSTRSKNILQIVVYVIEKTGLKEFQAQELKPFYDFVTKNYISDLNARDLATVQNAFKNFVESGGEVTLKKE
ncbi:DUF2339 domain-containing protein [Candidatus Gracilibacteria bacterium]|nr:DUF2339 domain-containing protein [Candidatus Gracilibacteria bacterium]